MNQHSKTQTHRNNIIQNRQENDDAPELTERERKLITEASFCYYAVNCSLSYNSTTKLAQSVRAVTPFILPPNVDIQSVNEVSFAKTKATAIVNGFLYSAAFEEVSKILLHQLIVIRSYVILFSLQAQLAIRLFFIEGKNEK